MMGIFSYFKSSHPNNSSDPSSAEIASKRLRALLEHERSNPNGSDVLKDLRRAILKAIREYIPVEDGDVDVQIDKGFITVGCR